MSKSVNRREFLKRSGALLAASSLPISLVEIAFGNGKDATINIDSDQNGSFETLLVTLDNYKGDLGMEDIQTDVS